MKSKELKAKYGDTIKPKELADFLGLDQRTIIKYANLWGGVQVSPGRYRFFENRIKEILDDAWFDNEKGRKALESQHHGTRPVKPEAFPGRDKKVLQKGRSLGEGRKGKDGKRPNRHGLLDDPVMV